MILDIHTHHEAPQPEAIVNLQPLDNVLIDGQLYSVGIHPWSTGLQDPGEAVLESLERLAENRSVVMIGECGLDTQKGGPLFRQMLVFKRQIEISERVGKPLLIHDVKSHDNIIGMRSETGATQPWIIHGFRGKPQVAEMLLRRGFMLSYGEKFNPDSLRITPKDRLLAETDESTLRIEEIISRLSEAYGEDVRGNIIENISKLIRV